MLIFSLTVRKKKTALSAATVVTNGYSCTRDVFQFSLCQQPKHSKQTLPRYRPRLKQISRGWDGMGSGMGGGGWNLRKKLQKKKKSCLQMPTPLLSLHSKPHDQFWKANIITQNKVQPISFCRCPHKTNAPCLQSVLSHLSSLYLALVFLSFIMNLVILLH